MILTCSLICIIKNHNNYEFCIYIDKSLISIIFFLSLFELYLVSVFVPISFIFFRDINFLILIDIFVTLSFVLYYYFYGNEQNYHRNYNRPTEIINFSRIRHTRRNRHNNRNVNRNDIINRSNLLIAEKEEFECPICCDINTRYYDIPCFNVDHVVCENCSKNSLFNIKKCPWCNIQVRIVYQV